MANLLYNKEDIYIINLDTRKDRWNLVTKEVAKSKIINPIRFDAIKHKFGENGCALSHMSLIEKAKNEKMPYIIVWEDDTEIRSPCFDETFLRIMDFLKNNNMWDVFNGNPANMNHKNKQNIKVIYPFPVMVSYEFATSTNFMIYSERSYDKMLGLKKDYVKEMRAKAVDVRIMDIPLIKIACVPYLTRQRDGKSDIMKREIKYDTYILERGEKFITNRINSHYIGGRLLGGLGNQMFVMAAAFCMAKRDGCILSIKKDVFCPHGNHPGYWNTFFKFLNQPVDFSGADKSEGEAKDFQYREIKKTAPKINLTGYFQHTGFFYGLRDDVRRLFMPNQTMLEEIVKRFPGLDKKINPKIKVSVHVRRGDYVKLKNIHHNVPMKYYEICRDKINAKYGKDNVLYYIFSDDIPWCRNNLKIEGRYVDVLTDYQQIILMSLCDAHIIANSTFSWWGAYLSKGPDEVYMPHKWMERPAGAYPHGLVLDGWNKVAY